MQNEMFPMGKMTSFGLQEKNLLHEYEICSEIIPFCAAVAALPTYKSKVCQAGIVQIA